VVRAGADPESHLRWLTNEALRDAVSGLRLAPVSIGLQAVANAFVMLGLLPEARAEAVLAEHKSALEASGLEVRGFELTVRSGAHGYWDSRVAGNGGLAHVPLSVAAGRVRCPVESADVYPDWVTCTPAGLRLRMRAVARQQPPDRRFAHAIAEVAMTDDTGQSYRLDFRGGWRRDGIWAGDVDAEPRPAGQVSWLEFNPADPGGAARVVLPPPASVPAGKASPRWPTPAEGYLAVLALTRRMTINQTELGPKETAGIVAAVADSLLAVGALPAGSTLLRQRPEDPEQGWRHALVDAWSRRAERRGDGFPPGERHGLAVRLPLEHATAVIEGISVCGDRVFIWLYGHPWVQGEYWPVAMPCFDVRAFDDAGQEHQGLPADSWRGSATNEGSGGFVFWPPVRPGTRRLRVIVSTFWEAAWADIELPAPARIPGQDAVAGDG